MLSDVDLPLASTSQCPATIASSAKDSLRKLIPKSNRHKHKPEDDISLRPASVAGSPTIPQAENHFPTLTPNSSRDTHLPAISFTDLPSEILEAVVGFLLGDLGSTSVGTSGWNNGTRNWSSVMRHPRRKQLSDLALVSRSWRYMIQERLYRHIKVKGTKAEIEECGDWFLTHAHLQTYVRHIEFWVPVWEIKPTTLGPLFLPTILQQFRLRTNALYPPPSPGNMDEFNNLNLAYQISSQNATLEEIFACALGLFPEACCLTIEGGHCKKPPRIQHFRQASFATIASSVQQSTMFHLSKVVSNTAERQMPVLPNITTLVLKGAWNIIREESDFHTIACAMPNLREWHCTFAKPKTQSYVAMCTALKHFPPKIFRVNICLEGLYGKHSSSLQKWRKVYPSHHICHDLGHVAPQLESLNYTGRVCGCLFSSAADSVKNYRDDSRLKSVDLIVKNCCRDSKAWNDTTGIHSWPFIGLFTSLVVSAVRSLQTFPALNSLRIRFIDLDSPCPLMNPYFQLKGNKVSGIWNEEILSLLREARPAAGYEDLGLVEEQGLGDGRGLRSRPKSLRVESYAALAEGGGLNF